MIIIITLIELDEFMALLDNRLSMKQKSHHVTSLVAMKVRKEGDISDSLPPLNAPKWAVKTVTSKAKVMWYTNNNSTAFCRWKGK